MWLYNATTQQQEQTCNARCSRFLTSERVHQLVIDAETAAQYATVYRELRRRGRPIPTNDMWIAASALQHGFAVFSDDGHFREVSGLHVGMQLDDFLF